MTSLYLSDLDVLYTKHLIPKYTEGEPVASVKEDSLLQDWRLADPRIRSSSFATSSSRGRG
jgi:hypothetical protein